MLTCSSRSKRWHCRGKRRHLIPMLILHGSVCEVDLGGVFKAHGTSLVAKGHHGYADCVWMSMHLDSIAARAYLSLPGGTYRDGKREVRSQACLLPSQGKRGKNGKEK